MSHRDYNTPTNTSDFAKLANYGLAGGASPHLMNQSGYGETQEPGWVSYEGLQARLFHLGWLGEELTGVLDRHDGGARTEALLSVITAECAAVARTALSLAAALPPGLDDSPLGDAGRHDGDPE